MDVEDLDDDFFSFEPAKPALPAGGGFAKPRAGRRAGGSSSAQSESAPAANDSTPAHALEPAHSANSANAGSSAVAGAAAGEAAMGGGEGEGGYLPGVGRAGRLRRNFMLAAQTNEDAATASNVAGPAQNQPLLGRRASPRVDLDSQQQHQHQQQYQQQQPALSQSPAEAPHAPSLGGGAYMPSMGRRGRAAGGLLGLNAGGGVGGGGGGLFANDNANTNRTDGGMMNAGSNAVGIGNMDANGYAPMMGNQQHHAQQPQHLPAPYAAGASNGMQDMRQQPPMHHGQPMQHGQAQEAQQQQYQPQLQPPQNSAAHQPMMQQQWGGEQAGPVSLNNYASQQQAPQQAGQEQAAPSKPLGFKFKFGAKATPSVRQSAEAPAQPAAAPAMGAHVGADAALGSQLAGSPQKHAAGRDAGSLSPEMRGPVVRASHDSGKGADGSFYGGAGQGARSEASRMSQDSAVSDHGGGRGRKGAARAGDVKKSDRLRKLEEELNGLAVTQELAHAYVDPSGRNLRPREMGVKGRGEKADRNESGSRLDNLRGGADGDVSRNEVLKAYKQAEVYRQENQRLKNQLDQCMNSFEEIARLKNLVAEKVKVIAVMEKERTAMQKLHRQYQKERTDQDSLENEYGERMRRVNEDLRVAKARCNKYKEIHMELEKQLAQEQAKAQKEADNNRHLKEKLRAIQGLAPGASEEKPFDPSSYKETLEKKDETIKKLEHDMQILKKAKQVADKQHAVKAKENRVGKDHYREQAEELETQLQHRTRELKENQVLVRKLQSQMRRMKLEITSLQKLNQDRIKLGAIMGEAPIETPEPDFGGDDDEGSTFLTHIDPDLASKPDDASSQASSRASTAHKRPPVVPVAGKRVAVAKTTPRKAPPHKEDRGPGGPTGGAQRHASTPPTGGGNSRPAGGGGGNSKDRRHALAQRKPETPADLASMISAQRSGPTAAGDEDDVDDAQSFAPYGKPPPLKLGAGHPEASPLPQRPAYEKLLSPEARSVLEDARSWRSATQTQRTHNAPSIAQEEEGGYEDDFESIPSSRLPSQPQPHHGSKPAHADAPHSPRLDTDVEDEVEEEDMDFLLAGLT